MKQLVVAGLGIEDLSQLTLESLNWVKRADEVLYLGTTPETHIELLKNLGAKNVFSISQLYIDGEIDDINYARLYKTTLEAVNMNDTTLLLVPGHPRIGVSLVQRLEVARPELDFSLKVLPGVSSFDTMLNDLARDPLEKGSLILDANRMLLFQSLWDPSFDCYIYHICSVGTRNVHLSDARLDNDWISLKSHLLRIYSLDTIVELISSTTQSGNCSTRKRTQLRDLESLLEFVHFGTTLFIPGQNPQKINWKFLNQLKKGAG